MWKRHNVKIIISTTVIIAIIGGFNWLVDPFDIFDSPKIVNFNANKPEVDHHERVYKAFRLQKLRPKTIFLGTSRTEHGMDPLNQNLDAKTTWNSAISGGLPLELEYYFDTAVKNGASNIIIGVDLFTFYSKNLLKSGFDKEAFADFLPIKYLLSTDVLKSSLKTIASKKTSPYLSSGMRDPVVFQAECDARGGPKKMFIDAEKSFLIGYRKDFSKDPTAHWKAFERIIDKAHKDNIIITLFISPSHARLWEILAMAQGWGMFEEYRRRLVEVNERVAFQNSKPPFPLWDFTGYHTLTTEVVPDDPRYKMKWYWEGSHYKKELGDIVLDRMFDGNYSGGQDYHDFGVKLTSQNIEAHLAKLRSDRAKWQASHPVDVAQIEVLKSK